MSRGIKAIINPALLRWARESAGYDLAAVAKTADKTEECIRSWESGEDQPTIPQLRKVANKLKRPLAVFYLSEIPEDFDTLRDLRRLPDGKSLAYSPKLRFLLRRVQSQQAWAAEFRREHNAPKVKFVGKANLKSDIPSLARQTRSLLNVKLDEQAHWRDPRIAFQKWVEKCEAVGVFVFQSSGIQPEEMRGCSFSDEYAPAILINSKDPFSARIFTLFHEFAHLLLNENGVSNLNLAKHAHTSEQRIEVFCNGFAAEILVPMSEMSKLWKKSDSKKGIDEIIYALAKRFAVSREVIARRFRDAGFVENSFYEEKREKYQREYLESKEREDGKKKSYGMPQFRIVVKNNGRAFSRTVLSAYADGDIYGRDVSGLLDTKLKHLDAITHDVFTGVQEGSMQ